jgi:hypothetical protein
MQGANNAIAGSRYSGSGRRVREPAGPVRGNKAVAEHEVVARCAPQAGRVPGVEDCGVGHRQEHEPHFRPSGRGQPRLVAIDDAAATEKPRRMGTATGQWPLATRLVSTRDGPGNPVGPERAGDHRPGISEDFGGGRRWQQPRELTIAAANHHAPARGAIHSRDGLDHLAKLQRAGSGTTQGGRHEEAEDPSVDEGVDHRAREPAFALGLVCMLSD